MIYQTTHRCNEDLVDIYLHGVVKFGIEQAELYHAGLITCFALLAESPHLARERSEFTPPIRLHSHERHIIIYVESDEGILIIRVLHGRQDWKRHLLDDGRL